MKTLETVQTLSKVGKIFSKIIYVCSLVGAIICAVAIAGLPFSDKGLFKIGGVSVYGLVAAGDNVNVDSLYAPIAEIMIFLIGQVVPAKFSQKYFENELTAGTPFTFDGAHELLTLGVLTLAISTGSVVLAKIIGSVIIKAVGCGEMYELDIDSSIMCGVMLIAVSFICKYGAEILNSQTAHTPENEEENLYE